MPNYRDDVHIDKLKEQVLKMDSLDNFKPINNSVLVHINDRHDEITYGTLTLKLDTSFEPGIHAENKGVVVKVPDKYIYSEKPLPNTGDWETEIEVQPGDQVWFDYLTGIECSKIECDDKLYYVLPYHTLYIAKRKDKVIPLNGYVLCSPIIREEGYKEFKFEREEAKFAVVAYAGSCNKRYRSSQNKLGKIFYHDDPEVKVGCKVVYGMSINLFLEQEEHSSFNGNERYRIVQRRHLSAIMETENVV